MMMDSHLHGVKGEYPSHQQKFMISLCSTTKDFNNSTNSYNLLGKTAAYVTSLAENFGDMPCLHHQEMMQWRQA